MSSFNYGITGKAHDSTPPNVLFEPSLQCYKGRQRGDGAGLVLDLDTDQFDVSNGGHHGVFKQRPLKKVYFVREVTGFSIENVVYGIRIEYDIVTLTTSEQAEAYQLGFGCT